MDWFFIQLIGIVFFGNVNVIRMAGKSNYNIFHSCVFSYTLVKTLLACFCRIADQDSENLIWWQVSIQLMVMGIVKKVFCFFLSRFGSTADFLGLQQHFHVTMCSCTFKICSINLRGHWVKLRDYEGRWVLERFYCRSFGTVTAVIIETREIDSCPS